MPPRKKTKASAASTPLAETQPKTPQETGATSQSQDHSSPHEENEQYGLWSDDQETQLFKSMMKWKPTGLHKHFRMISIHNNMRSHGFASEDASHTRIPGVWRKLDQLYDLRALDERENAYAFSDLPDPSDPDEAYEIPEFELPEEDFGELMWQKRFHGPESEAASSPPAMQVEDKSLYQPGVGLLHDLPEDAKSQTLKAESLSGATPAPKNTKNTRASRSATKGKATRSGQSAKNSKAQPAKSESESAEEEGEDEEDEGEDDDDSSSESAEETAPSTRRTNRSAVTAKAKPAPKRTRKR